MAAAGHSTPTMRCMYWFASALCARAGPASAAEPAPLPWTAAARESAAPLRLAADAAPGSREALFGDDKPADSAPSIPPSRKELFGETPARRAPSAGPAWHGFLRGELAYTYADPEHWSKMLVRGELD